MPKPSEVSITDARRLFAEIVNRAAYTGECTVLHRHGKQVAAVVPYELLRGLDLADVAARHRAQAAPPASRPPRGKKTKT